ncbi:putative placenta-specific gene 8 protein-like [Diplonema papillatum]|nr:putative placenta-specific gene 8 protein-like [Diplonema papillatum]
MDDDSKNLLGTGKAADPTSTRWSSGIFDCHADCTLCLKAACCGPVVAAETKTLFAETPFLLNCLCSFCHPCVFSVYLRNELRKGYGIQGTACKDCAVGTCCFLCNICQMHREVTMRGKITCGGPVHCVHHETG